MPGTPNDASLSAVPARLDSHALRGFADRLDLGERLTPYTPQRWSPQDAGRQVLHLEDVSAIPFLNDIDGVEEYQHRARVRASSGDFYATVTPTDPDYDTYCTDILGIGTPEWVDLRATKHPLAVARACREPTPFRHLVDGTRKGEGLVIHPYMSIEDVWGLADRLATESRCPVTVLGPPPPVTWIANDKALFTELVELVLGPGFTPETQATDDVERLASLLRDMSARHDVVGIKRARCASSMGNLVLDAEPLRGQSPAMVQATVDAFLQRTEWAGDEPVLAVAWERASSSPSTQWWIPPSEVAPPRLDGIYEQILEGDRKRFVGSRPSGLPSSVHRTINETAGRVAAALQFLGYVGRCSFDHLVLGDPHGDFTIRFTECNGRWGGTSTPMHLVDRVVTGPRPPYRAQDFQHDRLANLSFFEILDRVGSEVFDHRTQRGRFIFYNVGPLPLCGKLDVTALGSTQAEAEQALLADLPRCLGL